MTEQDYIKRIRELEAQVEHDRIGKQLMQKALLDLTRDEIPWDPPTPEEIEALQKNIDGQPIREIIAELKAELERESAA